MQIAGWAGTLVISIGMIVYLPMQDALVLAIFRALLGLSITSFALRPLCQWVRSSAQRYRAAHIGLLTLSCLAAGLIDAGVMSAATRLLVVAPEAPSEIRQFLIFSTLIRTVLYGCWSLLYFGIHYYTDTQNLQLRAAQKEAALRASELQMLRSQVNPHFLFNALNSILAASDRPPLARQITLALADYLRFSLQQRTEVEQLSVEISALKSYLQVEKYRFEANLEYHVSATASALQAVVPVAMVQPLLENALKYGAQSTIRPLKVAIIASVEDEMLCLNVSNSGGWMGPGPHASTGVGLANLRRRLELLYGASATLVHETSSHEVIARVRLPLHHHQIPMNPF